VSKEISWKRYEWTGKCCEEWDESGSIKLSLLKKVYEMGSLRIPVRVMMTVEGTGDVWGDASLALAVGSVVLSATGQHHVAIAAEIFSITAKLLSVHGVRLVGQTHTMGSPVFQPDGSGIKYGANINFKVIDPPGEIGTTSTYYTTHKISEQDCTSKNSNAWVDHLVKRNKAKRELEAKGQEALEIGGQ
jgi:hypothetical protein